MRSPRRFATAPAVVVATLVLAGCGGSGGSPNGKPTSGASTAATGPTYRLPAVGSCYALKSKGMEARALPQQHRVDCAKPHTAVIAKVIQAPASVRVGHKKADPKELELSNHTCDPAGRKAIGGSSAARALTMFDWYWWAPTPAQLAKGAHWIACGVGAYAAGSAFLPLPAKTPFLAHGGKAVRYRKCMNSHDNLVSCAKRHSWTQAGSFRATGKYAKSRSGQGGDFSRRCGRMVASSSWGWSSPSRYEWTKLGVRTVICFRPA